MVKVFLSSTYKDLVKYRQAAINELRRAGHEVICMEDFGARAHTPAIVCRELLANCKVYVLILAKRYGTIPDGFQKSMTELEYEAATKSCMPRLVFLLDQNMNWPADHIDQGVQAELLNRFLNKVSQSHTPAYFGPNPSELAKMILKNLDRWMERDHLALCLHEMYSKTIFEVESDLYGVVRGTAERFCHEAQKENREGGPVFIGLTGGPVIRQVIKQIAGGDHNWTHCQWVALNRAGECDRYFYSANYQCTQLSEMTGGISYASLREKHSVYEAMASGLRILLCSCGGTDSFLIHKLKRLGSRLPTAVGDFCLTPIDEKGMAIHLENPRARNYLKRIAPRPKFSKLSELKDLQCKIILPLARTDDPNVVPVDITNRVRAVKAVLSAQVVARCILSVDMAKLLLPPQIRGYQLLDKTADDQLGVVYRAMRRDAQMLNVRIIDTSQPATGSDAVAAVDKEILISQSLEPLDGEQTRNLGFPYLVMGSVERVRLYPGVRKPGNWAATAIRLTKEQVDLQRDGGVRVLDLGCGSGAIGLYLARSRQVQKVVFADIDSAALRCTGENLKGLDAAIATKCKVVEPGDLFSKLTDEDQEFEVIIFGAPFFPLLGDLASHDTTIADLAGPEGNEIALRFVKEVRPYIAERGCAITYLPDYVAHDVIFTAADEHRLIVEKQSISILYPEIPKHKFPPAIEIANLSALKNWLTQAGRQNPFTEELWSHHRFLGFEMVFFVLRKRL